MRPRDERVGLNMSEQAMGTNAPGIVAATGQACTVTNGEHYFDELHAFRCAAAPIRDVHGRLAGVLNLMVEEQHFSFDASPVVGMYATTIENTLLQAQSHEHLVLRFQVTPALLHTPLQALMGVAADGRVAWMNGTAAQLIGQPVDTACSAQELLGHDLSRLLQLSGQPGPAPLRLASGLGVWMQAHLQTSHGLGCTWTPAARKTRPARNHRSNARRRGTAPGDAARARRAADQGDAGPAWRQCLPGRARPGHLARHAVPPPARRSGRGFLSPFPTHGARLFCVRPGFRPPRTAPQSWPRCTGLQPRSVYVVGFVAVLCGCGAVSQRPVDAGQDCRQGNLGHQYLHRRGVAMHWPGQHLRPGGRRGIGQERR
jgi:hypothetical protein